MYKIVVKSITEGFSPLACFVLGIFSVLFGVMFIMIAGESKDPFIACLISLICFAIAIACFTRGRFRQFAGSLIGTALFCMSVLYLLTEMTDLQLFSGPGETSIFNAVLFLSFLGIPGITYAVKAKFGLRKKPATRI